MSIIFHFVRKKVELFKHVYIYCNLSMFMVCVNRYLGNDKKKILIIFKMQNDTHLIYVVC